MTSSGATSVNRPRLHRDTVVFSAVLLLAVALRFALALCNREANDDHMEVVSLILQTGHYPTVTDCWECHQPKLFHAAVAWLVDVFGLVSTRSRILVAQLLNATSGAFTVLLLWWAARRLDVDRGTQLATFSLVALNPRLIAINAQATNDSFVILFGTLAVIGFLRLLEDRSPRAALVTAVGLILASVSKGQGLGLFVVMVGVLLVRGVTSRRDRRATLLVTVFLATTYLATVPFLGPYWSHYKMTGTPFPAALDGPPVVAPSWFEKSVVGRPGVRSVADAYLTFRLFDLLREPYIRGQGYAEHRTSFWSQLYAGSQLSRFENWPPTWRTKSSRVLFLGRCALLLGLVPLGMIVVGVGDDLISLWRGLRHRGAAYLAEDSRWPVTAIACGMILLVMKYSYDLRDFSSMKAIFIFPAIAAFMVLCARGARRCLSVCSGMPGARVALCAGWAILVAVYVADISMLIADLCAASASIG